MAKKTYTDTPETLLSAILAMQDKLIEQEEMFRCADLMIEVEAGDGHVIPRANPLVQEYRALVKDFSSALKAYKEMVGNDNTDASEKLKDIRERFKVIA